MNKPWNLKLEISKDYILSYVKIDKFYESFSGIVHGGIVATILDEIMAQASFLLVDSHPSMTVGLRIRYAKPMQIDKEYIASAKIISTKGQISEIEGVLKSNDSQEIVAVATGTFFMISSESLFTNLLCLPEVNVKSLFANEYK